MPSEITRSSSDDGYYNRQNGIGSRSLPAKRAATEFGHSTLATIPQTHPSRRHSAAVYRRPLRSSPLAGPAFSSESAVEVAEDRKAHQRVNMSRVLSSPEISTAEPIIASNPPPLPSRGAVDPIATPKSKKRASFLGFSKSKSRESIFTPEQAPERPPIPQIPLWALEEGVIAPPRSRSSASMNSPPPSPSIYAPAVSATYRRRPQSPKSIPGISTQDIKPPANFPRAFSHDSVGDSWLTTNTYDTTPRFSRLSMASSGVVLPITAKKANRLSRASSRTSIDSSVSENGPGARSRRSSFLSVFPGVPGTTDPSTAFGNHSAPNLRLNRYSSNESDVSRTGTIDSDILCTPSTSTANSSIYQSPVSKSGQGRPRERSDSTTGSGRERRGSLANVGWGMRKMSVRLSQSKADMHAHMKGMSFLSFGSEDDHGARSFADVDDDVATKHDATVPIEKTVSPTSVVSHPTGANDSSRTKKPNGSGTVRRIWRTLSGRK